MIPGMSTLDQTRNDPNLIDPYSIEHESRVLEAVLQSQYFEKSPKLRALLMYLWEHRDQDISEYAIAIDALERRRDFDSKIDATVRVQIARLRKLLKKYYEEEKTGSDIQLVIPLGTHRLEWKTFTSEKEHLERGENVATQPDLDDGESARLPLVFDPASPKSRRYTRALIMTIAATILVITGCTSWLTMALIRRNDGILANGNQKLPLFWRSVLGNGRATRIVLPTPVFFTWVRKGDSSGIIARDISVNESMNLEGSSSLAKLQKQLGKPMAWQNYTAASDTVAALQLVQYFNRYGIQNPVSTSAESPQQITNYENIVAFGTASDLAAYKPDLDRLDYQLGPNNAYVTDKLQSGDRAHQFAESLEPGSRIVVPGLIALVPRGSTGSWLLLVQGAQTAALTSYLISENGIREIEQAQAEHGHAKYFEAIALSEVNEGHPIQSRLVAFRPFVEPTHPVGPLVAVAASGAPSSKTSVP